MKEKQQPKRSEAYIELRERLYDIYYYSYIIARLDMPDGISRTSQAKRIRKSRKELYKKIQSLIIKWEELTKAECGEVYSLVGLKSVASINGNKVFVNAKDKEALRRKCEERLSEVMPKPKRKRMTAVRVGR